MATGAKNVPFSMIGADVVVDGNLSASVDLHIDGRINGDVNCAALAQGESSTISGAVKAESARVAGAIVGSIEAGTLIIERTARIKGDIRYDIITIEQGATVEGDMGLRTQNSDIHLIADNSGNSDAA